MTDFSKIFGEFVGAQWGDVGIAPYEPPGKMYLSGQTKEPRDARLYEDLDY